MFISGVATHVQKWWGTISWILTSSLVEKKKLVALHMASVYRESSTRQLNKTLLLIWLPPIVQPWFTLLQITVNESHPLAFHYRCQML